MSLVRSTTDDPAEVSTTFPRTGTGARASHRRVVMTSCQAHGSAGIGYRLCSHWGLLTLSTATTAARRAGPREHGREAARSKWDRPGLKTYRNSSPTVVRWNQTVVRWDQTVVIACLRIAVG